jgi:hypothetical protein
MAAEKLQGPNKDIPGDHGASFVEKIRYYTKELADHSETLKSGILLDETYESPKKRSAALITYYSKELKKHNSPKQ